MSRITIMGVNTTKNMQWVLIDVEVMFNAAYFEDIAKAQSMLTALHQDLKEVLKKYFDEAEIDDGNWLKPNNNHLKQF